MPALQSLLKSDSSQSEFNAMIIESQESELTIHITQEYSFGNFQKTRKEFAGFSRIMTVIYHKTSSLFESNTLHGCAF